MRLFAFIFNFYPFKMIYENAKHFAGHKLVLKVKEEFSLLRLDKPAIFGSSLENQGVLEHVSLS